MHALAMIAEELREYAQLRAFNSLFEMREPQVAGSKLAGVKLSILYLRCWVFWVIVFVGF